MPDAPLVIVNPTAGGGRAGRLIAWLGERLATRPDARLRITTRPGDAERWAAEAIGQHDRVVAVGGDGTVQETVNGLLAHAVPATLGIVPMGSGNDLARSLGLPRPPGRAWSAAIGREEAAVDAAWATNTAARGRWFASASGIGFDGQVAHAMVRRRAWQRGQVGYLVTTLTELRRFTNREVRMTLDGGETLDRCVLLVAVTNGAYYGGGMHIAPGARVDDGLVDLCIVGDISRLEALRQLPNLYRGRHTSHPAVEMRRTRSLRVEGDPATLVHLDGEPFGTLPIEVEMRPGMLTVAVPAALGSAP